MVFSLFDNRDSFKTNSNIEHEYLKQEYCFTNTNLSHHPIHLFTEKVIVKVKEIIMINSKK
jgi:hypothetical protein